MIRVERLVKCFGRLRAVDDVTFHVRPGESVALWGPNGAGKTTVIRCILGLLRYDGAIAVAGLDVRRRGKACRRAIGYVPQELAMPADLRVAEAAAFFARLKRAGRDRPAAVLAETGLEGHERQRLGALSGGQKQRMALALALLADPPLLLLDEPTSNLDGAGRRAFLAMLDAQRRSGRTLLFTSHRPEEVRRLADRIVLMAGGRIAGERVPRPRAAPGDNGGPVAAARRAVDPATGAFP